MCQGRKAYHLASRPRLFECAACGHQHSGHGGHGIPQDRSPHLVMAGYLIGHDKRGVSAMLVCREFAIRYDTAWLMCHKLGHTLTDDISDFKLDDFVEVDEAFYGGRKQKGNRGRAQNADKAMIVAAVEKVSTVGKKNKGINKQGFLAGGARIAVLANATAEQLGWFIRSNIKPSTLIVSDGFKGYTGLRQIRFRSRNHHRGSCSLEW